MLFKACANCICGKCAFKGECDVYCGSCWEIEQFPNTSQCINFKENEECVNYAEMLPSRRSL